MAEDTPHIAERELLRALATTDRLSELLVALHAHAVAAVGGRSAMLFEFGRAGDWLQATSAFGVEELPTEPWRGDAFPSTIFQDPAPLFVPDVQRAVAGLAEYLGSTSAVLVPLVQTQNPIGVLVLGCAEASSEQMREAASVGYAFVIAIERTRSISDAGLQRDLRNLLHDFTRAISANAGLIFCSAPWCCDNSQARPVALMTGQIVAIGLASSKRSICSTR